MEKLVLWFIPPENRDGEDRLRKARYFVKACLFTAGFSFFYLWVSIYFDMRMPTLAMVHNTILIGILPFLFRAGLPINTAGNLFVLFGTIGLTWTVCYTGGFESGTLVWYGVLPVASLLLVNKRGSYVWTTICLVLVLFIGALQILSYPFENQIDPAYIYYFDVSTLSGIILMLFLLALVFENTKQEAFAQLNQKNTLLRQEKQRSDTLLLNILPQDVAEELKEYGRSEAKDVEQVTIIFTDFKEFTQTAEKLTAQELVQEINVCFEAFDGLLDQYKVEKIKTIGDAYMAAGGLPVPTEGSTRNTVITALEMQQFIQTRKASMDARGQTAFEMRAGIHTGAVVAGIVGVKKFQYDIWGDTVNIASRMESNGEVGKVNVSQATYELLQDDPAFKFESRGKVRVKGKGEMEMYFVSYR